MSVSARIEAKNYVTEAVEEEVYAGVDVIAAGTTSPKTVVEGKIKDGFDAVAVGVGVTRNGDSDAWLSIGGKQHYPTGLNTSALGGLDEETLLLVKIPEGKAWAFGLTNTGVGDITQYWRIRIRLFRK